jgi:hypothetical protein
LDLDNHIRQLNWGPARCLVSTVRPNRSGELYLYVNEAVFPLHMDYWYRNNKGSAMVTITQRDR